MSTSFSLNTNVINIVSRITNRQRTNIGSYHYEFSIKNWSRVICILLISIFIILLFLTIIGGSTYCGYWILSRSEEIEHEGDEFNIIGDCKITGESESCFTFALDPKFPCPVNKNFAKTLSIYYEGDCDKSVGDVIKCYTNTQCDAIYVENKDQFKRDATLMCILSAVVFCAAICIGNIFVLLLYKCSPKYSEIVKSEIDGLLRGRNNFYSYHWLKIMNFDDRFDYIMSNWCRQYGIDGYDLCNDGMICKDIQSVVYMYCMDNNQLQ